MKKITRMVIFSAISLYLTSYLIKGFIVKFEPKAFITTTIILALIYYLLNPLMKVIFFPLNVITVGFFGTIAYVLIFSFFINKLDLVKIVPWTFQGAVINGFNIPKIELNYWSEVALSAISYSTIINLLEIFL